MNLLGLNAKKPGRTLTLDLETTIFKSEKRVANPFDSRNWVVMSGWKYGAGKCEGKYWKEKHKESVLPDLEKVSVIIGFNIKFDMLWFWKDPAWIKFLQDGGRIYDCQYVEYLLHGMTKDVHMVNLADTAIKYGGTGKLDVIKELWKQGVQTNEIPEDTLTAYLLGSEKDDVEGDINSTYRVFKAQMKKIKELPNPEAFLVMVGNRMDGLLASTEMEWNGLFINEDLAEPLRQEQLDTIEKSLEHLNSFLPEMPEELNFNWGSPTHKSCTLFGGAIPYEKWTPHLDENGGNIYPKKTEKWPLIQDTPVNPQSTGMKEVGGLWYLKCEKGKPGAIKGASGDYWLQQDKYKSGKQQGLGKFRNVKVDNLEKPKGCKQKYAFDMPRQIEPRPEWEVKNTDADGEPIYSTGSKVMEEVAKMDIPFCKSLQDYVSSTKDLGTYYWVEDEKGVRKGMLTLVRDGLIHHKLCHINTVTGRMSSTDPNMQNIPRQGTSKVKQFFTSRFGSEGMMLGIDYKQLEILVQAIITNDENLIKDIWDEIDFHCRRLSMMLGEEYETVLNRYLSGDPETAEIRVKAKNFSFARAFGAGATAIVDQTKLPLDTVKTLIQNEDILYPGVKMFDNWLKAEINQNMTYTGGSKIIVDGKIVKTKKSSWQSPFGTIFSWIQHEAPEFMKRDGIVTGFSPTERKNYPVQGTGGEIVQTVLGRLFRWWIKLPDEVKEELLLVNTVHDCVIWDGKKERLLEYCKDITTIMESVHVFYAEGYGIELPVHFRVDAEIGNDLYSMTSIHKFEKEEQKDVEKII